MMATGKDNRKKESARGWRRRLKEYLIELHGGKCAICGYDKCADAFEFHHVNPDEKKFSIGSANPKHMTWEDVLAEAEKCIMVCSNCHREIHAGLTVMANEYEGKNHCFL